MAIWQVVLYYVKNGNNIDYSSPVFMSSLKKIEEFFPETKSWSETIKQYGELDSTCIEIDIDNSDEIAIRIDLRSILKEQLQGLVNFALQNDFSIKYNDVFYEPSIDILITILRDSDASKFIVNPKEFLETKCTYNTIMFPDILDGAKVLFFSPKGNYGTMFDAECKEIAYFSYLAIGKYDDSEGYYLFKCNDAFEVESDFLLDSIEMCISCAENLCNKKIDWIEKE